LRWKFSSIQVILTLPKGCKEVSPLTVPSKRNLGQSKIPIFNLSMWISFAALTISWCMCYEPGFNCSKSRQNHVNQPIHNAHCVSQLWKVQLRQFEQLEQNVSKNPVDFRYVFSAKSSTGQETSWPHHNLGNIHPDKMLIITLMVLAFLKRAEFWNSSLKLWQIALSMN